MAATSSASPQKVRHADGQDVDVWPEHWGISASQVRALVDQCRLDPRWRGGNTMRDLVRDYVMPLTAGKGVGYALDLNGSNPKEVTVIISHSWNENAEDFADTLTRSIPDREYAFICAFSLFQNCDGSGPSIAEQLGDDSPFYRVLLFIRNQGTRAGWRWQPCRSLQMLAIWLLTLATSMHFVVTALGSQGCSGKSIATLSTVLGVSDTYVTKALSAELVVVHSIASLFAVLAVFLWCLDVTAELYRGRMVVLPNHEDMLYSRLWCVYEMFVARTLGVHVEHAHSFATVASCDSSKAFCSNEEDRKRIRGEIELRGKSTNGKAQDGYALVDSAIHSLKRRNNSYYAMYILCAVTIGICGGLPWTPSIRLSTAIAFGFCLCCALGVVQVVLRRHRGRLSCCGALMMFVPTAIAGCLAVFGAIAFGLESPLGLVSLYCGAACVLIASSVVIVLAALHVTRRSVPRVMMSVKGFLIIFCVSFLQTSVSWLPSAPQVYVHKWHFAVMLFDYAVGPILSCCLWWWLATWGAKTPDCRAALSHCALPSYLLNKLSRGGLQQPGTARAADACDTFGKRTQGDDLPKVVLIEL